jgi:NTE family protein
MLLVRPSISHIQWLSFNNTQELIDEGYRSAVEALAEYDTMLEAPGGIYPRRRIRLHVDRALCNGCAICVAKAPHMMALDAQRRAYALSHVMEWSPADGDFVRHCPTGAVSVEVQ